MNKLYTVSRRSFLKGLAGITAIAATGPALLDLLGVATVPLTEAPQVFKPTQQAITVDGIPLEVETITEEGVPEVRLAKDASAYEEMFVRDLFLSLGYTLAGFDTSKGSVSTPVLSPSGWGWGVTVQPCTNYTVAYRYATPTTPNVPLNYMRAYSFHDLLKTIKREVRPMRALSPAQLEQKRRATYGDKVYDDIFVKSSSEGTFPVGMSLGGLLWRGMNTDAQLSLAGMRPGSPLLVPDFVAINNRGTTGFPEGGMPTGWPNEFANYHREEGRQRALQQSALRKLNGQKEPLTAAEDTAVHMLANREQAYSYMYRWT